MDWVLGKDMTVGVVVQMVEVGDGVGVGPVQSLGHGAPGGVED